MPRPKNLVPTYKRHRTEARCWAGGRWVTLGPWNSPESRAAHARICAELVASPPEVVAARTARSGVSVAELVLGFLDHAEEYHRRPDGTPTNEVKEYKGVLKVVRELYGLTPAAEFGPVALKTVRSHLVEKLRWCRSRVNKQVGRVRRMFKWAVSEQLVKAEVWAALKLVDGLRKNRSSARETPPVRPAPEHHYQQTLPELVPTVRTMVELQRTAGLRPCEVRLLVPADLDRSSDLWVYAPDEHKMSHLGIEKAIPIPPTARKLIEPWLVGRKPQDYLFSPRRARQEMYDERRSRRRCKVYPSDRARNRKKPWGQLEKRSGDVFTDFGYAAWVRRACIRAEVPPWSPGQLRHAFGTEVRERFGLDVAQALMGHTRARTTEIYAEVTMVKAAEAARELG